METKEINRYKKGNNQSKLFKLIINSQKISLIYLKQKNTKNKK